jgi:DNA-binding MltR family transcriptional regulator
MVYLQEFASSLPRYSAFWRKNRSGTFNRMALSVEAEKRLLEELDEGLKRSREFHDTLIGETSRGCALVAAAFLEQRLLELLRARMIESATAKKFDMLFEGFGPMASFAARSHLAYVLGFIANNVYEDLCLIRGIRNRFAHSSGNLDFNDDEIKTKCGILRRYIEPRGSFPRGQFIEAVAAIEQILEYLILNSQHATMPVDGPEEMRQELRRQREFYLSKANTSPSEEPPT